MTPARIVSSGRLPDPTFWDRRRVLVTGHTGFKGSWLSRWLGLLGAEVHGLALAPSTAPALYDVAAVGRLLANDLRVDLRDNQATIAAVTAVRPDVVLHLAAQPLVRDGYRDPATTYTTNVGGTANLLAAIACLDVSPGSVVVVTSDKVYLPHPAGEPHSEKSALGGIDPYSSSKTLVEEMVGVFRALPAIDDRPAWTSPIATARAGNVIGGGDWSKERLVPDCIRSFEAGDPIELRYPAAVRPWQHVLDPLAGYLLLAEDLANAVKDIPLACNFGPSDSAGGGLSVVEVAHKVAELWGVDPSMVRTPAAASPPETAELRLDSSLATASLGWRARWDASESIERTVDWYRAQREGADMAEFTDRQIREFAGA